MTVVRHRDWSTRLRSAAQTLAGRTRGQRRADVQVLRASTLFDGDWYLQSYPDVAQAGIDPLIHYLASGWREGRDPGPEFATSAYLKAYSDVARSGANPLLHYIEFGYSEGREAFGHRRPLEKRPVVALELPSPAPCVSFPSKGTPAVRWRRSYNLDRRGAGAIVIDEQMVGNARDAAQRQAFKRAFKRLAVVSGYAEPTMDPDDFRAGDPNELLVDAWYATAARLRTRWRGRDFPFVVRVYQHDPSQGGLVSLVGEGLTSSEFDVIDLDLANPFFPLLFIIADAEGALRDCFPLTFPSLCRGGLHYSELLWATARTESSPKVDLLSGSRRLATRLMRCLCGEEAFALGKIVVDLEGADGGGRLFQADFQIWLDRVARIRIEARAEPGRPVARFLADAVKVTPSTDPRTSGLTLRLSHDMVPTVAALAERLANNQRGDEQIFAPLLVAGAEPSQPATCIELPHDMISLLEKVPGSRSRSAAWPRLMALADVGLPKEFPAAAIRNRDSRGLSDAELLAPVGTNEFAIAPDQRQAITWMIRAEGWQDGQLEQAVELVGLQQGGDADAISFVGSVSPNVMTIAQERFDGRVAAFSDYIPAARELGTPLMAFVGTGLLLQHHRSALLLSALLADAAVATASCALIFAEKRGRGWHVAIADCGSFATPSAVALGAAEHAQIAEQLWSATYPVTAPSPHFWVARAADAAEWLARQPTGGVGVHLCTSLLTATCVGEAAAPAASEIVPGARDERATKVSALCG